LKGTELRDFIKEQQNLEREERNQHREHDMIPQDKQDKFRLAQMEREKEKEQREREKEQHEKEQREQEADEKRKDRELEREKMDFELKMKAAAAAVTKTSSEIDENEEGENSREGSVASGHTRRRIGAKGPKMPCFDERSEYWTHFCTDLRYMQKAKDGVKDSGLNACQHF